MPGYDSYVKALLHMNGSDGSTTFTEEGGKSVTAVANAQIDTAQGKFNQSGLLDGTDDYIYMVDHDDWYLGTGDFTIDFWVRFNSVAVQTGLFGQYQDANNFFTCYLGGAPNNQLNVNFKDNSITRLDYGFVWSPSINTWYHLAFVRSGTSFLFFEGGDLKTWTYESTAIGSNSLGNLGANLDIGRGQQPGDTMRYLNGWKDEFRWSKGIARWTSDFSVPTEEYAAETFRQQTIII